MDVAQHGRHGNVYYYKRDALQRHRIEMAICNDVVVRVVRLGFHLLGTKASFRPHHVC